MEPPGFRNPEVPLLSGTTRVSHRARTLIHRRELSTPGCKFYSRELYFLATPLFHALRSVEVMWTRGVWGLPGWCTWQYKSWPFPTEQLLNMRASNGEKY